MKEEGHYVVLSDDTLGNPGPLTRDDSDEDSDASSSSPQKKQSFINKLFKTKAKDNGAEASVNAVYNQLETTENEESHSSLESIEKPELKSVFKRKKRTLAFFDKTAGHQRKYPFWAKIKSGQDKPKKYRIWKMQNKEEVAETSNENLLDGPTPKPLVTSTANKEEILEEFDPLWSGAANINEKLKMANIEDKPKIPVKPPRNKILNEKMMLGEKMATIKIPELKIATLEAIPEIDFSEEEQIIEEVKTNQLPVKASVSYEGLDGVFAWPVVHDNSDAINEGVYPTVAFHNISGFGPQDMASASSAEQRPVIFQPREDPWNVLFGDYQAAKPENKKEVTGASKADLTDLQNKKKSGETNELESLLYQPIDDEEKAHRQIIADFFAEKARSLDEEDIANYSNNIEISKIEIYEEDIKRYHQSLTYHRGPVDHDIIFSTVETALNFVEKLDKEREQKKKGGFFPDLLDKCLKSKAKREKEKEEEEKKRKEKEENRKKGPLKPKMWLVFNRLSKEKVIICTPGDFYDSE